MRRQFSSLLPALRNSAYDKASDPKIKCMRPAEAEAMTQAQTVPGGHDNHEHDRTNTGYYLFGLN